MMIIFLYNIGLFLHFLLFPFLDSNRKLRLWDKRIVNELEGIPNVSFKYKWSIYIGFSLESIFIYLMWLNLIDVRQYPRVLHFNQRCYKNSSFLVYSKNLQTIKYIYGYICHSSPATDNTLWKSYARSLISQGAAGAEKIDVSTYN